MTASMTTAPHTYPAPVPDCSQPPGQLAPAWLSDSIGLGTLPEAAPLARAWTRELLCEWGLADLADDAETVAAELLANAIEATERAGLDTQIRLTLIGSSLRTLVITVWDGVADGPPVPGSGPGLITGLVVDDDAESGRGLLVAAAYSARLDWKHAPGGKIVRALLRGKRARR